MRKCVCVCVFLYGFVCLCVCVCALFICVCLDTYLCAYVHVTNIQTVRKSDRHT